ncbi:MAG: hypothetical protein ABIT64_06525, partial [Lysobacteraceae bacterium]
VEVTQGETLFNMLEWETQIAGLAMKMSYAGQATGYIAENTFQGVFSAQYYCDFPETGRLKMFIETTGSFRVQIDNR